MCIRKSKKSHAQVNYPAVDVRIGGLWRYYNNPARTANVCGQWICSRREKSAIHNKNTPLNQSITKKHTPLNQSIAMDLIYWADATVAVATSVLCLATTTGHLHCFSNADTQLRTKLESLCLSLIPLLLLLEALDVLPQKDERRPSSQSDEH